MSGIYDVYQGMGNYMEDKRGLVILPSGHPVPVYVYDADKNEREAWLYYVQVIEEELESEKGNPDYARLREANESWKKAADSQTAAHIKWEKVRYL